MSKLFISKAQPEEYRKIARLIAGQNQDPSKHCLQSASSEDEAGVYEELMSLDPDPELLFVVARQDEGLIGTLGCEIDPESGRGWLKGPFVLAEADEWNSTATRLLQEILTLLPASIHRLDSFLNVANEQGIQFYLAQGFQRLRHVHVYLAAKPEAPIVLPNPCPTLKPEQAESFISLHNTVFPYTYASGERLLSQLGEDSQLFVYADGEELLGYLFATIEEGSPEGLVEFVGVRPDARGRGIGRQLLLTALGWFFEVKKMPQVALTVNDELTNAQALYEKVGFRLKYTGLHSKKEWEA